MSFFYVLKNLCGIFLNHFINKLFFVLWIKEKKFIHFLTIDENPRWGLSDYDNHFKLVIMEGGGRKLIWEPSLDDFIISFLATWFVTIKMKRYGKHVAF